MRTSYPLVFECEGSSLVGIIERPEKPGIRAVLIVVGGPQYRVGSHRLFTILSRSLADAGIVSMRFDHRGIGDSAGTSTFVELSPDIRSAIDALIDYCPQVTEIVLWGLCDAASAAMMYAPTDKRVKGLVLLNPWVRSEQTLARSYFRGYYVRRLLSSGFWKQLMSGNLKLGRALGSIANDARSAISTAKASHEATGAQTQGSLPGQFQVRMMNGLRDFPGRVLIVLSGNDITADEFRTFANSRREYRRLLCRDGLELKSIAESDHTFSTKKWRNQVILWSEEWVTSW